MKTIFQTSFNSGIYSPLLRGRFDNNKKSSSMEECKNMLVLGQGPITRRAGSKYISSNFNLNSSPALIPFILDSNKGYILEFLDKYFRVIDDDEYVFSSSTNFDVYRDILNNDLAFYIKNHNLKNDDKVKITGNHELNNFFKYQEFTIKIIDKDSVKLLKKTEEYLNYNDLPSKYVNYANLNNKNYNFKICNIAKYSTPFSIQDLFDKEGRLQIHITQLNDKAYLCHPLYQPHYIQRFNNGSWYSAKFNVKNGPLENGNKEQNAYLQADKLIGEVKITSNFNLFKQEDIGRIIFFKAQNDRSSGFGRITKFINTREIILTTESILPTLNRTKLWNFGLWSKSNGYPSCSILFQDRLVFAGTYNKPMRLDFSKTGDYLDFTFNNEDGSINDDNAFSLTLNSNNIDKINWLENHDKGLVIGTTGSEWLLSSIDRNSSLTPLNIRAINYGNHGSKLNKVIKLYNDIIFVQKAGNIINRWRYNYDDDAMRAFDISLHAEHLFKNPVIHIEKQQEPFSIIWLLKQDGKLIGCTYNPDHNIIAFHEHEFGNIQNSKITSFTIIPYNNGQRQRLYLTINENINNQNIYRTEYCDILPQEIKQDIFIDAQINLSNFNDSKIKNLYAFNNKELIVKLNDNEYIKKNVNNNILDIGKIVSNISFGLAQNWQVKTSPLSFDNITIDDFFKKTRFHAISLNIINSKDFNYGFYPENNKKPILTNICQDQFYDGQINNLTWQGNFTNNQNICLCGDSPYNVTILNVAAHYAN